jgi:hypothetical protein
MNVTRRLMIAGGASDAHTPLRDHSALLYITLIGIRGEDLHSTTS